MILKISTAFDELEIKVKVEGRRINKEVAIRTQEENQQYFTDSCHKKFSCSL